MDWRSLDDVARAIRRYLEERASFDEIAADPQGEVVWRRSGVEGA
jgi:hypothetical protein